MWTQEKIRERLKHYLTDEGFSSRWAHEVTKPDAESSARDGDDMDDVRMAKAAIRLALEISNG